MNLNYIVEDVGGTTMEHVYATRSAFYVQDP